MRVAVLLSGQMRDWKAGSHNHKFFWTTAVQDDLEVDYFIHTWDYSQDRTGVSKPYETRIITPEEYEEYVEFYNPIKHVIDSKTTEYFYGNDHWSSLFYSFVQTLKFKLEYERENNFKYDVVVKSRPDIIFDPHYHFRVPVLFDNTVYSTHGGPMELEYGSFNFNDCVFLGNSQSMDLLINLYHYRQFMIREFDNNIGIHTKRKTGVYRLGPGVLMHEYFREYGITPYFGMGWQETIIKLGHPQGLNLFVKEEFDQMEKYFRDWYLK